MRRSSRGRRQLQPALRPLPRHGPRLHRAKEAWLARHGSRRRRPRTFQKNVPPSCRTVGAVEPQPTAGKAVRVSCASSTRAAVPGLSSRTAGISHRARVGAPQRLLPLGRRRSTQACRTRRAARVVVAPCPMEGHRTDERPLSLGARSWRDVPGATSTLRSRLSHGTRERATALAVSREEAQHASLPRACAVPRWLWSFCAP